MKIIFLLFLMFANNVWTDDLGDSYVYEAKAEYAKALESMDKLTSQYPGEYFYWLRSGWLAYMKGDFSKSNSYYQKATLQLPNSIESRLGQVKALVALGQFKQSDLTSRSILKIDPKNYYARSYIAYGNYAGGNYKEAEKFYESLVSDYPSDLEMNIGLGWTYLKLGKKAQAKSIFEKLGKVLPYDERVTSGIYYSNN